MTTLVHQREVTTELPLQGSTSVDTVVYITDMRIMTSLPQQPTQLFEYERSLANMKLRTSMRTRASNFLTDRYVYRERPDCLIELVAFGIIVITAVLSLANAITPH